MFKFLISINKIIYLFLKKSKRKNSLIINNDSNNGFTSQEFETFI